MTGIILVIDIFWWLSLKLNRSQIFHCFIMSTLSYLILYIVNYIIGKKCANL